MEKDISKEFTLSIVVVEAGVGSKVLKESKKIGVLGGTIFLGRGTIPNHLLQLLGLYETKKEIIMMVSESSLEDKIHEGLTRKFHLEKPNHGIIFSLPISKIIGKINPEETLSEVKVGGNIMGYEVLFTVVERGLGQDVVDAAAKVGSRGATIINGRGSGIHETNMFFSMPIEPEKEIVMILIERSKTQEIMDAINKEMNITEPGKGIIFALDVNKTSGLFNNK